jgi:hypothetical protein
MQKIVNYSGIRIFNNLPQSTRHLSSDVNFKQALKSFFFLVHFIPQKNIMNGTGGMI